MTKKHQFGLYLRYSERKNNGNLQKVIYVAKVSTESFFFQIEESDRNKGFYK